MKFSQREAATMLAALRYWQREGLMSAGHEMDIATNNGEFDEMNRDEIGSLCERIKSRDDEGKLVIDPVEFQGQKYPFKLEAVPVGDEGYREIAVSYFNAEGERVSDTYFTVSKEGEPRILQTVAGQGDGDHDITIYPLRPAGEAVTGSTD